MAHDSAPVDATARLKGLETTPQMGQLRSQGIVRAQTLEQRIGGAAQSLSEVFGLDGGKTISRALHDQLVKAREGVGAIRHLAQPGGVKLKRSSWSQR